jgi:hypothetical protein
LWMRKDERILWGGLFHSPHGPSREGQGLLGHQHKPLPERKIWFHKETDSMMSSLPGVAGYK